MENTTLNLARKWRSANFSQIVGQSVSVRILKNSLYLAHYFPVYLFAGQRGCGKTTTARVFAAAVNCEQLSEFQKNPQKIDVPCLACASCKAMTAGKHPDFIEVDGASHTGVDNVRSIIEAATLLPVLGKKRIYLIDEAHMLSKASFNAFLKILEEPPAGVLFILATTAPEKIIDTVRSRCFQLFFTAIDTDILCKHLQQVCQKEQIAFDQEGLKIIVRESEGSARDALNLLEQVRFSSAKVDVASVQKVLGHIADEQVVALLTHALIGTTQDLLSFFSKINIQQYEAYAVWKRLIAYARGFLWVVHSVQPVETSVQIALLDDLKNDVFDQKISVQQIYYLLQILYEQEEILSKTKSQYALLEMALLQIQSGKKKALTARSSVLSNNNSFNVQKEEATLAEIKENKNTALQAHSVDHATWDAFIQEIKQLNEPLLMSLFSQGVFGGYDAKNKKVSIEFGKNLIFFNDTLVGAKKQWSVILERLFGSGVELIAQFTAQQKESERVQPKIEVLSTQHMSTPVAKPQVLKVPAPYGGQNNYAKKQSYVKKTVSEAVVDVSDVDAWPVAHMVLQVFPGTITKVQKDII